MSEPSLLGPLMVDVAGHALTDEDRAVLRHPLVGGVILFTRNFRDTSQITALCAEIRALRDPRLLIAVDHEGGRVQRFRVGFSRIPPMRTFGERYLIHADDAMARARQAGQTIARELVACGIDLCFAPVLDIDRGISGVIGDRAFSDRIEHIVDLATAFHTGLRAGGMAATGKHFPGHGAVYTDSHVELPIDRRSEAELRATELQPFVAMVGAGIDSLMMAHVRYPAVDELPASLSRIWIRKILREELGFKRAVFCDDLSMGAAAVVGSLTERAKLALAAGCDMLPLCNDRAGVHEVLAGLKDWRVRKTSSARVQKLHARTTPVNP